MFRWAVCNGGGESERKHTGEKLSIIPLLIEKWAFWFVVWKDGFLFKERWGESLIKTRPPMTRVENCILIYVWIKIMRIGFHFHSIACHALRRMQCWGLSCLAVSRLCSFLLCFCMDVIFLFSQTGNLKMNNFLVVKLFINSSFDLKVPFTGLRKDHVDSNFCNER